MISPNRAPRGADDVLDALFLQALRARVAGARPPQRGWDELAARIAMLETQAGGRRGHRGQRRLPLVGAERLHPLVMPTATQLACQRACKQDDRLEGWITAAKNRIREHSISQVLDKVAETAKITLPRSMVSDRP